MRAATERRATVAAVGAALAAVLVVPALAGCKRAAAPPQVHRIAIRSMTFDPPLVHARAGDSIEWTNEDLVPHTATAAGRFDSGVIAPRAHWAERVTATGAFDYACTLHPGMRGRIEVR